MATPEAGSFVPEKGLTRGEETEQAEGETLAAVPKEKEKEKEKAMVCFGVMRVACRGGSVLRPQWRVVAR